MTVAINSTGVFMQAEAGIRNLTVTGVQTCALPIWTSGRSGSKPHEPAAPRRAAPEPAAAGGPGRPARPRTRDRPPGEGDDAGGARLRAAAVGMARRRGVAGGPRGGCPPVKESSAPAATVLSPATAAPATGDN